MVNEQQVQVIDEVAEEVHEVAYGKGWYNPPKTLVEQIALWHSEVSEALEELRNLKDDQEPKFVWYNVDHQKLNEIPNALEVRLAIAAYKDFADDVQRNGEVGSIEPPSQEQMNALVMAGIAKPEGFGVEAADVVIRIMDTLHFHGISLGEMIRLKSAYNVTRPHRHGGKRV